MGLSTQVVTEPSQASLGIGSRRWVQALPSLELLPCLASSLAFLAAARYLLRHQMAHPWVHPPQEALIQTHHELREAGSSEGPLRLDQPDQSLPETAEIWSVREYLDPSRPSNRRAESHLAGHHRLGFELDQLEEASYHLDLQSSTKTSWALGVDLARVVAASCQGAAGVAAQAFELHHQHQDGARFALAAQFAS